MKKKSISRRTFLKRSSLASAAIPFAFGGFPLYGRSSPFSQMFDADNDRILVLVQLQGGNDGLATLYHADQYANLQAVRENIVVPEQSILPIVDDYGLHPSMSGLVELWQNDRLGILQSVGYPNQNRSHFRSTDIWNSASSAEVFDPTGWIGRFYDLGYDDYPRGFPNAENPHPFALTMGKIVSETCQGVDANYSLSLLDPFDPGTTLESRGDSGASGCVADVLDFIDETAAQTNAYAEVIRLAAEAGENRSEKWASLETELAAKLRSVARLISGGLKTKVYIVQLGGFDTHDNQVVDGETTTGLHGALLQEMSDALCAFQDDLRLLNLEDRVIGMTYSEFGRRIRSNDALGTDHGTAAPLFLFGSCIADAIHGTHPEIDREVSIDEGVPMQFDFRDVYGTVLSGWLGSTEQEVRQIIHPAFRPLPLFKPGCGATTSVGISAMPDIAIDVSPNPATDRIRIDASGFGPAPDITIFDAVGSVVRTLRASSSGPITIPVDDLPSGAYFVHVRTSVVEGTKRFVRR